MKQIKTQIKALLICFGMALLLFPTTASASFRLDTIPACPPGYKAKLFRTFAIPTVLAGYGLTTVGGNGYPSDYSVRSFFQRNFPNFHTSIDDYLPAAPIVAVYGLNLGCYKGKNHLLDVTIIYGLSSLISNSITQSLKRFTKVQRPDGSSFDSFPSNHTASAFLGAEVLYQEYKDKNIWIGVAGYTVAASVGVFRMLNNRHWFSDVLVGAAIGILVPKLVYLLYKPFFKN